MPHDYSVNSLIFSFDWCWFSRQKPWLPSTSGQYHQHRILQSRNWTGKCTVL